jgi:hypothetical protein
MEKKVNRKGQELSIGTLILIVLGIIVLVLLVLGFSIGWDKLFSTVGISTGSDLSTLEAACKVALSTQSKTSFCEFKKVEVNGENIQVNCEYSKIDLGGETLSGGCGIKYDSIVLKGVKPALRDCTSTDGKNIVGEECKCGTATCNVGKYCDESTNSCLSEAKV